MSCQFHVRVEKAFALQARASATKIVENFMGFVNSLSLVRVLSKLQFKYDSSNDLDDVYCNTMNNL